MSGFRKWRDRLLRGLVGVVGAATVLGFLGLFAYVVTKGLLASGLVRIGQGTSVILGTSGVTPYVLNTLLVLAVCLAVSVPVGILGALLFTLVWRRGRVRDVLLFIVQMWAVAPSIVHTMVGIGIFSSMMNMGISVLTGALTMSLLVTPNIVIATKRQMQRFSVEQARQAISLGARRISAYYTLMFPHKLWSVLTVCLRSALRILGEATLLLSTAGAGAMVANNLSAALSQSGGTLSAMLFVHAWQRGDINTGFYIALLLLAISGALYGLLKHTEKKARG